jgi:hypothetical protein
MLTYVHYYTEEGIYLDHGKILDIEPYVGYIVERHKIEGYEPWEIIKIESNGTSFGNNPFIKATVKRHPYVKTHCDHVWNTKQHAQIIPKFVRTCTKCNLNEEFTYGTAKWTTAK